MHQLNELTYLAIDSQHRSQKADGVLSNISRTLGNTLIELYRSFIEYQLQLWYAYRGNRVQRFARDIAQPSAWKTKIDEIHKIHGRPQDAMQALDSHLIEDIPSKLDESLDRELLAALTENSSVANYPKAITGTCEWFLELPAYSNWISGSLPHVFLTSNPGCGKLVLLKALADGTPDTLPGLSSSFFFQDTGSVRYTLTNALCSMIGQLCIAAKDVMLPVVRKYWRDQSKVLLRDPRLLWKILSDGAEQASSPIYCIMDALDEADEQNGAVFMRAVNEYYRSHQAQSPVRLLVSARPYFDARSQFGDLVEDLPERIVDLHEHVPVARSQTIIDETTEEARLSLGSRDHLKFRLKEQQAHSHSLLWLRAILHQLKYDRRYRNASSSQIDRLIGSTPPGDLFGVYDGLLACSEYPDTARSLIGIVLAKPGISLNNLQIAFFYCEKRHEAEQLTIDVLQNDDDFRTWIAPICGFFLEYNNSQVNIFHQTALTFLHRKDHCRPEATGFRHAFDPVQYQRMFLEICSDALHDFHARGHILPAGEPFVALAFKRMQQVVLNELESDLGSELTIRLTGDVDEESGWHMNIPRLKQLTDVSDECFWRFLPIPETTLRAFKGRGGGPQARRRGPPKMSAFQDFFNKNHRHYHFVTDSTLRSVFHDVAMEVHSDCQSCDNSVGEGEVPATLHCSNPASFKRLCFEYLGSEASGWGLYEGASAEEFFSMLGRWYKGSILFSSKSFPRPDTSDT